VHIARKHSVEYVDSAKGLPNPDGSVSAIYSCHMLEHLDILEAKRFLTEAYRVLKPGGILRIVVPDLKKLVSAYLKDEDADRLIESSLLTTPRPESLSERFKYLLVGPRHHLWMYDARSLIKALTQVGFADVHTQGFGSTRILDPEQLDLHERASESICVEAAKP
ncbi:MAG: class I SAM-dependent methyltransferase, partial [Chloroflexota bacterium]